jgi:hypothetical protein
MTHMEFSGGVLVVWHQRSFASRGGRVVHVVLVCVARVCNKRMTKSFDSETTVLPKRQACLPGQKNWFMCEPRVHVSIMCRHSLKEQVTKMPL